MYLKVFKDDIIEGLHKSANIIPAKTGAAFLRTIWLKVEDSNLKVMSTDSNIEFSGVYNSEIIESGLAGVQGRAFYDLVKKLPPGEIALKLDPEVNNLFIEQGRRKYKLPTNDPTWYQNFSDFPEQGSVFWSGDFLQELIDRISFCISDEDSMEAIACMSFKPKPEGFVEVCGLNGHQFGMVKVAHDDFLSLLPPEGMLIQKKYVLELRKWLNTDEIELNIENKRLFFRTADKKEIFSLPLSYYQYPDYNNFLSKLEEDDITTVKVNRSELLSSLERLQIFNTENNRCTYFEFKEDELILTTQGQEVGFANESLEAEIKSNIDKIAFPTKNLVEILGHYNSDNLTMTMTGVEGPCGIRGSEDPEYTVIIMPMKIVEETYYSEEDA